MAQQMIRLCRWPEFCHFSQKQKRPNHIRLPGTFFRADNVKTMRTPSPKPSVVLGDVSIYRTSAIFNIGSVSILSRANGAPLHRPTASRCRYSPAVDIKKVDKQTHTNTTSILYLELVLEVLASKHASTRAGKHTAPAPGVGFKIYRNIDCSRVARKI